MQFIHDEPGLLGFPQAGAHFNIGLHQQHRGGSINLNIQTSSLEKWVYIRKHLGVLGCERWYYYSLPNYQFALNMKCVYISGSNKYIKTLVEFCNFLVLSTPDITQIPICFWVWLYIAI